MAEFIVKGHESFSPRVNAFLKEVQRKADLAAKRGKNKSLDLIMYGRTTAIKATNVKGGVVGDAAKRLRMNPEHLYYRSFVQGIKVRKPYASGMIRTNAINIIDLLFSGAKAKDYYGYATRKKGTTGTSGTQKRRRMAQTRAKAAKRAIKKSGRLKVAGRTYKGVFIQDGRRRNDPRVNRYYMDKLGADAFRLGMINNPLMIMQKKNSSQKKPYPTKVVSIPSKQVQQATKLSAKINAQKYKSKIADIQANEIQKDLAKLGFKKR